MFICLPILISLLYYINAYMNCFLGNEDSLSVLKTAADVINSTILFQVKKNAQMVTRKVTDSVKVTLFNI